MTEQLIKHIVHKIKMGDVEDPDLMIAEPIWKWQQTDAGKWVMENCSTIEKPVWHRQPDEWGHLYTITAYLTPKQLTYYRLKFE
jgi:hypothetical protein